MSKVSAVIKGITVYLIFSTAVTLLVFSTERDTADRKESGSVLYASVDGDFIFTDLGEGDVAVGDRVKIYRGSVYMATGSVKAFMGEMTEVTIGDRQGEIKTGDTVIISKKTTGAPLPDIVTPVVRGIGQTLKGTLQAVTSIPLGQGAGKATGRPEALPGSEASGRGIPGIDGEDSDEVLHAKLFYLVELGKSSIAKLENRIDELEAIKQYTVERKESLAKLEQKLQRRQIVLTISTGILLVVPFMLFAMKIASKNKEGMRMHDDSEET
jgi:hypothetical protein